MRIHDSASSASAESLLDVAALRADTPGAEEVVHFNNAGCGLLPAPVLAAMVDHLRLEAHLGGYEAAAARAAQVADFYAETAALINCAPRNVAFAGSATHAFSTALSAIPFAAGDVVLTTRNDFISNQIAFLSLARRFGIRVVHAPDLPEGGVDVAAMAALMRRHRPRLVAATHIPTNSGLVQPVAEIGRHCRELDLLYLVDACQSVGQYPVDVEEIGCDLLTATCRKFLRGPRGSGFLYVADRVLDAGYEPLFIDMHGAPRPWPPACAPGWPRCPGCACSTGDGGWAPWSPSPSRAGRRSRSRRRWTRAASTRRSASGTSPSSTSGTRTSTGACACRRTTTTPSRRWTWSSRRSPNSPPRPGDGVRERLTAVPSRHVPTYGEFRQKI
ncbi:aminotransferase class V-fold PLP-dependent enzyme [Nonomuraea sp. NPDC050227]|uniref:aminotransferase class V-fold PLP-dependent enzyme n=1 Tax=Nonomuraea sp. NPDC050227 TaxID=3364360 RepID=UPI00378A02A5